MRVRRGCAPSKMGWGGRQELFRALSSPSTLASFLTLAASAWARQPRCRSPQPSAQVPHDSSASRRSAGLRGTAPVLWGPWLGCGMPTSGPLPTAAAAAAPAAAAAVSLPGAPSCLAHLRCCRHRPSGPRRWCGSGMQQQQRKQTDLQQLHRERQPETGNRRRLTSSSSSQQSISSRRRM